MRDDYQSRSLISLRSVILSLFIWVSTYDLLNDILGKTLSFWGLILFPTLALFLMGLILIFSVYPLLVVEAVNTATWWPSGAWLLAWDKGAVSYGFAKHFTALQDDIVTSSDYCFSSCWYIRMCFAQCISLILTETS